MATVFNPFTGKLDFTGSQATAAIGTTGDNTAIATAKGWTVTG